jgi:tungstate transport system substrate-binding protein
LLPKFTEKTGLRVDVIAVGTGKALQLAEKRGVADVQSGIGPVGVSL